MARSTKGKASRPPKTTELRSTPDPNTFALALSVVRGLLQFGAGIGLYSGVYVTDSNVLALTSALVGIATLCWSFYTTILAARARHETAVLSARLQSPVKPAWRMAP